MQPDMATQPTPKHTAAEGGAVPPKWKLVPIHPTDAMKDVGGVFGGGRDRAHECYEQMVRAAPMPPDVVAAINKAAETHSPVAVTESGSPIFINYGDSADEFGHSVDVACPHCGGSGHKDDVKALSDEWIDRTAILVMQSMPGGIKGFCTAWGWRRFARELLEAAGRRDSMTDEQRLQREVDAITELNHAQWLALENVRTLAARNRGEEWAQHLLRWCAEAGNASRVLRTIAAAEGRS